jgi:UDP-N-acetylglucosamine 1-carboxyvinyltransferase
MILAGLIANGKTLIKNASQIDRGYENIDQKLIALGANIKRVKL